MGVGFGQYFSHFQFVTQFKKLTAKKPSASIGDVEWAGMEWKTKNLLGASLTTTITVLFTVEARRRTVWYSHWWVCRGPTTRDLKGRGLRDPAREGSAEDAFARKEGGCGHGQRGG